VEIIRANKRQQLSHIFDRVSGQEISGQLYVFSLLAMKFILKINNPLLTEEYISRFVDECVNAYGRTGMTCVRGIRERLILVFDTAFKSLCCQQGLCVNENIDQGTIDTLCPVDLIKPLLDAVANNRTFNTYSAQWSYDEANQDLELKDRRDAFIDAMTKKYTEGIEHEEAQEAQEAVRAAIEAKVRGLEEAERANFGCADVDDIFSDPVDCAKPKEDEEEEAVDVSKCCCMAGTGKTLRRCSRAPRTDLGSRFCTQHAKGINKNDGRCSKNGRSNPWC